MSPTLRNQQLIPYNSTHQCPLHFQLRNLHTLSHSSSVTAVSKSRAGRQVSRGSIPENCQCYGYICRRNTDNVCSDTHSWT